MKKMDIQIQTPTKKVKLYQGTQQSPQELPERRNPESNHENFIEMLLDMVNQNVQEALKKFQDNKNKEYETTQKQTNGIIGALSKHQSETENTIYRKISELRPKFDNIKEEVIHDMESLRKKNETETQHTMEGHSSRIEQAEDRISELEVEMVIKGKTEELVVR
jgi:hypothetical protein